MHTLPILGVSLRLLLLCVVNGVVLDFSNVIVAGIELKPTDFTLYRFGSNPGGRVSISLNTVPPDASVVVSYIRETLWYSFDHRAYNFDGTRGYCHAPAVVRATLNGTNAAAVGIVPDRDVYLLLIQRCEGDPVRVSGHVELTNGGAYASHLSIELLGYPQTYANLAVAYALGVAWWAGLCALHPPPRRKWLHVCYGALGVMKALSCGLQAENWWILGSSGARTPSVQSLADLLDVLSLAGFLGLCMLVSFGYFSRSRSDRLERREWTILAALLGTYTIFGMLYTSCISSSAAVEESQCNSFAVVLMVLFAIACALIVVLLNFQIATLHFALAEEEWTPAVPSKYALMDSYASLRSVFVALFVSILAAYTIKTLLLDWTLEWMVGAMLEASQFAAALAIGAVLAPRLVEDVDIVIAAIEEVEVDRVEARRRGDVARLSGRSGGTEEDSGTRRRRPR